MCESTISAEAGASASPLRFLRRALGFSTRAQRRTAWFWTIAAFLLLLANLAVNVGFNRSNRWFFDALEKRDGGTLFTATLTIVGSVVVGAAFAVLMVRCRNAAAAADASCRQSRATSMAGGG